MVTETGTAHGSCDFLTPLLVTLWGLTFLRVLSPFCGRVLSLVTSCWAQVEHLSENHHPTLSLVPLVSLASLASLFYLCICVLCYASDLEVAAVVVEHSVVIRVTSFEHVQLTSTRLVLYCLLMICKAHDVVVDIRVLIPCTAGTPFRRINEKLGAESDDFAMTYKLEVAAVGLYRHDVRIDGGFSWKWSNCNELWKLVVVRNLSARCGSSSCLVSPAVVGQKFVHCEESVFHFKKKCKIVMMRPRLIEVMAPSVLGVSDLKAASFLSSQASRKLSCAVLSTGGLLDRKTVDVPVPVGYACALCTIAGPVYHYLGFPLPPLLKS